MAPLELDQRPTTQINIYQQNTTQPSQTINVILNNHGPTIIVNNDSLLTVPRAPNPLSNLQHMRNEYSQTFATLSIKQRFFEDIFWTAFFFFCVWVTPIDIKFKCKVEM
jgi:hypothetical protein